MEVSEARQAVRNLFVENADIKDQRVVDMLVEKVRVNHDWYKH